MKFPHVLFFVFLFTIFFNFSARAQDISLKTCQDEVAKGLAGPTKDYKNDLKELQREFQNAGDLDSFLAVRDEIARFDKNPAMPNSSLVKEPELLAIVQGEYQKDCYLETNKIAKKYVDILVPQQVALTRQGKIDEALAVRTKVRAFQAAYKESFSWEDSYRLGPPIYKVTSRALIMGFTRTEAVAKRLFSNRELLVEGVIDHFDRDFSHGELFNVYFTSFGESDALVQFAFKISEVDVKKTQIEGKETVIFTKKGDKEKGPLNLQAGTKIEILGRCQGKHLNVNFTDCSIPDNYWPLAKPVEKTAE